MAGRLGVKISERPYKGGSMAALLFALLMFNSEALEVIGEKSESVVHCSKEITQTSYFVLADGACVESVEFPGDSYISVLFTQSEKAELDKLVSEIKKKGSVPSLSPEACTLSAAKPAPYLFLANKEDCSAEDNNRLGGCFELDINPGFDMPDTYYLPEHLPEPAPYKTKIKVQVIESRTKEICLPE